MRDITMSNIAGNWIGKNVTVTLRMATPTRIKGIWTESDEDFVALEQGHDRPMLIPLASILYIEPTRKPND
jgi:hypothetical protein